MARFQDIPVPRRDVLAALLDEVSATEDAAELATMRALFDTLTAIYHFEFHAELELMKRSYAPFNPDLDDERFDVATDSTEARAQQLNQRLRSVLERGNYKKLTDEDITHAFAERSLFPLAVVVDTSVYEEAVIYARGETERTAEVPRWYGLRQRVIQVPTFDRVCLYIRFKPQAELEQPQTRRSRAKFEPGTTILKLFRNIPKADLEILFPNCQLEMRASDKLFFGVPALLGGIPVIAKMIPAAFALAILLGLRRGEIDTGSIITGLTGLVVLGAYLFRQWGKFRNRRVLFNKELTENLYFRNLDNNEGVLTRLVDEAEEEECKEALLAYFFLHRATTASPPSSLTEPELDAAVEAWLSERFQVTIDFEIGDALTKLEALGMVVHDDQQRYTACSPEDTLAQLHVRWDAILDRPQSTTRSRPSARRQ
ncbi:TMEM143 family protein [Enhygromyxa salina]|nr:TMEM143 family protein [Enhygromyxa salina]